MEERFMRLAIKKASETMKKNIGGPFGAVIVKDGIIVALASNSVLRDNDPTAHAEINAIRLAGRTLGTYDLSGCELYTTGYPCPMCLSAIIWANIKKVYYGCNPKDADKIGFRDDFIYNYINDLKMGNIDTKVLDINETDRKECLKLFDEYKKENKIIY